MKEVKTDADENKKLEESILVNIENQALETSMETKENQTNFRIPFLLVN